MTARPPPQPPHMVWAIVALLLGFFALCGWVAYLTLGPIS